MDTHLTTRALLFSVPDPTDWDGTKFPLLNPLDSALRCDICKDFYNSPVITNCSHTFCSVCIRRALHAEQICPICRTAEQEYRLRKNPVVQELVDAFLSARPKLFEVATEVVPVIQRQQADSPLSSQYEEEEGEEGEESSSPPAKRPRPSQRATRSMRVTPKYTEQHYEDVLEVPAPSDGLVPCPSCHKRIKMELMNSHLDSCLSDEYKPPSQSSLPLRAYSTRSSKATSTKPTPTKPTPTAPLQPLPKISYSFLKDNVLRSKLVELGIPSHGPRKLLQERHSEWMTIWNANVDAKNPRSKKELLADLASWERAHLQPSNQLAKAKWSDDQWRNTHGGQFDVLIKDARARAQAAKKKKEEEAANEGTQQKYVNGGVSLASNAMGESLGHSSEQLGDANVVPEARPTAHTIPPALEPVGELNGNMPMPSEPNIGFGMVGPHMDEQNLGGGPSRMAVDPHNGKRKHNEIDGAPITGAV